jgi:copper(I)-binding protein
MWHLLLGTFLLTPAVAHDYTAGSLVIAHPFAIETATTAITGAGYLTITNNGTEPDRLLAAEADFPRVEIHRSETGADGVARMVKQDGVDIGPGETVELAPGGLHVMFMGLDGDPFVAGEAFPATLVFERAAPAAIEFRVEPRPTSAHENAPAGHEQH